MLFILFQSGNAGANDAMKKYFNDTASKVKATPDPAQKREIIDKSLQTMATALDKVESSGLISQNDRTSMNRFKTALKDKQDELKGMNGHERVSDGQLNAFADYVVQDMNQAALMLPIGVVSVLLIIIILILLI